MAKSKKYYDDLVGKKFNRLTITGWGLPRKRKNGRHYSIAKWICDCGTTGESPLTCVLTRYISCGCFSAENPHNYRHGLSKDRLFHIWSGMKHRCDDDSNPAYENYGGRGITYLEDWKVSDIFFEWAKNNGYAHDLTLERIDVNKGYYPENCTWIPFTHQARNTRKTVRVAIDGITKSLREWSEIYSFPYTVAYKRHRKGWLPEQIFKEPI